MEMSTQYKGASSFMSHFAELRQESEREHAPDLGVLLAGRRRIALLSSDGNA